MQLLKKKKQVLQKVLNNFKADKNSYELNKWKPYQDVKSVNKF